MFDNIIEKWVLGLIPQFIWDILPYWPYIFWSIIAVVAISLGYRIYKLGGWPALVAATGAAGVALGYWLRGEHTKPLPPPTELPKPKKTTVSLKDLFKRRKNK